MLSRIRKQSSGGRRCQGVCVCAEIDTQTLTLTQTQMLTQTVADTATDTGTSTSTSTSTSTNTNNLQRSVGHSLAVSRRPQVWLGTLGIWIMVLLATQLTTLCAQTYKINKYGLKVIEDVKGYQTRIQSRPDLALWPLEGWILHLKTDFVYATPQNFTGQILYEQPAAYLRKPAALALKKIAGRLENMGYGLLIYDAYRPYSVTVKMWEVVPDNRYAANPRHGSGHNRGLSVDLSLYDLKTGQPLAMPTGFDDFTARAHGDYMDLPDQVLKNRALLKKEMIRGGFKPLSTEWWHFTYPGSSQTYYLMDLPFKVLKQLPDLNLGAQ